MQIRPVALVVLLIAAACGDEAEGGGTTTTAAAAPVTTVLAPEGFPVVDVADREQARLELISPDWLVADAHSLWVKRDDGGVEQIDPETNEVLQTIDNEGAHCAGLGVGFGSVWTCSVSADAPAALVRFSAASGELQSTLPVTKSNTQGHVPTDFDHVWVLTGDGSTLVGVDPETEEVAVTAELGVRAADVRTGPAGLWVVSTLDDQVLRVDPASGEVLVRVTEVRKPVALSVTDEVWVGAALTTHQLEPDTGAVLVTSEIGTGANGSVAVTDDGIWVRSADRFLVRLDHDGVPVEGIASPDTPSGGDVIVAFGSLWTAAYDEGTLFRISLPG